MNKSNAVSAMKAVKQQIVKNFILIKRPNQV